MTQEKTNIAIFDELEGFPFVVNKDNVEYVCYDTIADSDPPESTLKMRFRSGHCIWLSKNTTIPQVVDKLK